MAEFEELRLTVTLIDNASQGLAVLRQNLRALGGQENRDAIARMQKDVEALGGRMGRMREEVSKTSAAVSGLGHGMAAALGGFATAFISNFAIESLKKFTDEVVRLDATARTFGVGGANLKALVDQMRLMGIDPNAAATAVTNFRTSLAELGREGSKLRQDLIRGAITDPAAMQAFIARITGFASKGQMASAMNEIVTTAQNIFDNEMKRTGGDEGKSAELRNRFLRSFGADPSTIVQIKASLKDATAAEQEEYAKRLAIAAQFNVEMNKMGLAYDEAVQKLQTGMLPSLIAINAMIKDMGGSWEAFGSAIGKSLEFVAAMIKGVADLKKALSLPSTPDTVQSVTPDEAGQQRAAAGQQPLSAEQQAWAKRRQAERLRLQWERAQKNNELPPGESAATAGIKKLFGLDPKGAPGALDEPAPTGPGTPGAAPPPTDAEIRAERKRKILAPPTPPAPAGPNELGLPSLDFDSITKENDLRIQQMQEDIRGAPNAAAIEAARKRRILAPAPVANPVSFQTEGGANPLLHSGGDEGGGGAGMFKNAIRVGVFEGMIDFSNYLKGGSAAGGGAGGGIQNASFQMPGGGGLPSNIKIPGEVGPRGADTPISRAFASAGTPTAAAPPTAATPSPGAPNGSHVGPGTGPGAGNTPADGGGAGVKGGAGAAGGRAAEAMEYFKSQGWSHEQAAGLAANLNAESGFKTGARGDAGSAGGIAQWHGDRQKAIEKQFGKPLSQMSYQEQLAAVNWELSKGGPEARAGAALRATKTAREAGATASRLYERPKNVRGEMARRGAAAEGYAAMPPVSSTTSEAKSGTGDHPIPGAVIEKAHSVAQLGPAALSKWMASQGYPQHDQWCGDFAAAVVKSAGGTPPKGWALASNWRNVGPEVSAEDAQPGDVAVARPGWSRRGSGRTGEAGSHVTILNEKLGGGKFAGLGGNQGHGRIGRFNTGQFQFYRPNVGGNGDGSAALDRSALDRGTEHRVHGTGKLSVDVKAPRGTKVDAEGDGLFKKTEIDRQTQMEPAQSAPRRGGGGDETISI